MEDEETTGQTTQRPGASPAARQRLRVSDGEIEAIAERLRAGEPLDERYRALLSLQ